MDKFNDPDIKCIDTLNGKSTVWIRLNLFEEMHISLTKEEITSLAIELGIQPKDLQ